MVLISGNNKSAFQQAIDERARAQGVTVIHNSQQQVNKSVESGRTQSLVNTGLSKAMSTMDEFKAGFPKEGLSTTSNKWWGSSAHGDSGKRQLEEKATEANKVACETGKSEKSETPQGSSLLTTVRKRAVEEGREAFKIGVFRGYGVNKLSKREKILLHQIFRSSLPRSWIHD